MGAHGDRFALRAGWTAILVGIVVAGGVAPAASAAPAVLAAPLGSWQTSTAPPSTKPGKAVALANGSVLVVYPTIEFEQGPSRVPGLFITTNEIRHLKTELYDPASGSWVAGPSPPGEEASTLVALPNGAALLIGEARCEPSGGVLSRTICSPTATAYTLGPGADSWTAVDPMLVARTRPAAVVLADGRVLVTGGFGDPCRPGPVFGWSCPPVASAELFDPVSGTWTRLAPMPSARGEVTATVLSDQGVLIAGGGGVLRFHPRSSTWTELAPAPALVGCARLLPLPGDRAIAFGGGCGSGFDGSIGTAASAVQVICESLPEIFSAARDSWTAAPPLIGATPLACSGEAAPLPHDQVLYENEVLDAKERCWSPAPAPASAGSLVPLQDGSVLSLQYERPPAAELYTSAPASCAAAETAASELFEHMAPEGARGEDAIVSRSGDCFEVHPLTAGVLRVTWYTTNESPEGPPHTPLAHARGVAGGDGKAVQLTLRMGAAERREFTSKLRTAGFLKVFAEGTFRARSGESVTVVRPFYLRTSEPLAARG
jgi:hypothetical protein